MMFGPVCSRSQVETTETEIFLSFLTDLRLNSEVTVTAIPAGGTLV